MCFERHSFIQFASWTSEPLKTEVRHHASAPHSKSVLNLSVWDENSWTLHHIGSIKFHSRISWTLGVAVVGIRMRCDPSCRCCSCCVQMMWNPFPSGLLERLEWQWLRWIVLWVSGGMAGSSQQKNRRKKKDWTSEKAQKRSKEKQGIIQLLTWIP